MQHYRAECVLTLVPPPQRPQLEKGVAMNPRKLHTALTVLTLTFLAATAWAGDAYLGITMSSVSPSMARALQLDAGQGILVDEVAAESPADEGGVKTGDVIIAIGDNEITGLKSLQKAMGRHAPGDKIRITVWREGKKKKLKVTLGEQPEKQVHFWSEKDGGQKAWNFGEGKLWHWSNKDGERQIVIDALGVGSDRGFLGIMPENTGGKGVLVAEVIDDSPAEDAGLESGDIIVAIDDEKIDDSDELHDFLDDTKPEQTVTVRIKRDGKTKEYKIALADAPVKVNLADNLKFFMPHGTGTYGPRDDSGERSHELLLLHREREDVQELKDELDSLKAELDKLREELNRKK